VPKVRCTSIPVRSLTGLTLEPGLTKLSAGERSSPMLRMSRYVMFKNGCRVEYCLLTVNQVYAEATIAFPLIVAASFAKANQAQKEEQPDAQTTA
jgi:hypothetical protein